MNKFQFSAISRESEFASPHTIFLHYSDLDVRNIHESPVTEDQFESRAMLKTFAVAAARAQHKFGVSNFVILSREAKITLHCSRRTSKTYHTRSLCRAFKSKATNSSSESFS